MVFDDTVDLVLERVFVILVGLAAQRDVHGGSGASALAGVGFVDDDGEFPAAVLVRDGVDD